MRFWLIIACCLLASGVFSRSLPEVTDSGEKRAEICQDGCNPSAEDSSVPDDEDDDEPKRLVVYYNFEKVMKHGRISDKSGYENSGTLGVGGEILKFNDKDYTCNQAARLWDHDIVLRGDTFQAKPKYGITIAAWLKLEEKSGQHSIFDTIGSTHTQGQFHFEVNDGVVRWFHRDEKQKVVFETMAHTVPRGVWTHVAGTYDAKTKQAKIFINGEIRNQSLGEGMLSRDWGVRAGIGNKEKHRPLRGSIDEFRIYNYALKNDEIKALVTACKNGGSDATGATAEGGNQPEASAAVNGGGAGSPGGVGGDGGTDQAASTRTLAPTETKEKEADGIKDIKDDKSEKADLK